MRVNYQVLGVLVALGFTNALAAPKAKPNPGTPSPSDGFTRLAYPKMESSTKGFIYPGQPCANGPKQLEQGIVRTAEVNCTKKLIRLHDCVQTMTCQGSGYHIANEQCQPAGTRPATKDELEFLCG